MTNGVDLDRLADYTAGLLDGTPQAAEVAELIATRPDWAQAFAVLADADRVVRADLAALGTHALTMPPDVVARLDAALGGSLDEAPARPQLTVLSGDGAGAPGGRRTRGTEARARRRRQAWVGAVAAGIIALGGFGVALVADLPTTDTGAESLSGGGRGAPEAAADALGGGQPVPPAGALSTDVPRFVATGTNYFAADVAFLASRAQFDASGEAAQPQPGSASSPQLRQKVAESQVAPPLRRLIDPAAMNACLRLVMSTYGGQATLVDFARFQNEPALVVLLADPAGRPVRVVVTGPACGLPEHGADVRYTTPVT